MDRKKIILEYETYTDATALDEADRILLARARQTLPHSFAPYSQFRVAAAVRLRNGHILTGANTENAAYPMCLCAERAALAAASSAFPHEPVVAIAITVQNENMEIDSPAAPCGACRQVLVEYEDRGHSPIRIILQGATGPVLCFERARDLLPFGFSGAFL